MLAIAVLSVGALGSAGATPVTVAFTGTVTDDPFGVGFTSFEGTYTFDSAAADSVPDISTGSYTSLGAGFGISASFDSGAATASVSGTLNIGIANDFAGPIDQYTVTGLSGTAGLGLFLEASAASVFRPR